MIGLQVVLPMLDSAVVEPGWISEADFLTGIALVQAMPGPLFNIAAYVGKARQLCTPRNFMVQKFTVHSLSKIVHVQQFDHVQNSFVHSTLRVCIAFLRQQTIHLQFAQFTAECVDQMLRMLA